jgi:drug/metabolite transporter (DMT)-like permease
MKAHVVSARARARARCGDEMASFANPSNQQNRYRSEYKYRCALRRNMNTDNVYSYSNSLMRITIRTRRCMCTSGTCMCMSMSMITYTGTSTRSIPVVTKRKSYLDDCFYKYHYMQRQRQRQRRLYGYCMFATTSTSTHGLALVSSSMSATTCPCPFPLRLFKPGHENYDDNQQQHNNNRTDSDSDSQSNSNSDSNFSITMTMATSDNSNNKQIFLQINNINCTIANTTNSYSNTYTNSNSSTYISSSPIFTGTAFSTKSSTFTTLALVPLEDKDITTSNNHQNLQKTSTSTSASAQVGLSTTTAIALLNVVAIIWGTQHAIIKLVIDDTGDPSLFTLVRFTIAAIVSSLYLLLPIQLSTPITESKCSSSSNSLSTGSSSDSSTSTTQLNSNSTTTSTTNTTNTNDLLLLGRWGLEMGIWMFLGFSFQAIGLEYTTAQQSGFLLYLNVKFVPLLSFLLFQKPISTTSWISAFVAFVGTSLLAAGPNTVSESILPLSSTILDTNTNTYEYNNIGTAWSIAAALASAMFIIRLEQASKTVQDSAKLNATSLWVVSILSLLWTVYNKIGIDNNNNNITNNNNNLIQILDINSIQSILVTHPIEFLYLSVVATAGANYIQTTAQSSISAERASVIYALDPVYGAIFSYLLLGETLSTQSSWFGAGLITLAGIGNILFDFTDTKTKNRELIK